MYSQINGEVHYPDCEQHRRTQSGRRDLNVMTPIPMGSHVSSARFSGRSCVQELCPDCGKVPQYTPRVESFAFQQSVDKYIESKWINHYFMQEELPFSEQNFPNSHYVHNSTVMTQTSPKMVHCHTSPMMMRKTNPKPQTSFDSVPSRKNKSIARRKKINEWKRAFKAVKPHVLQKPGVIESDMTKLQSPKIEKNIAGDCNAVVDNKTADVPVIESPKLLGDGKGDGPKMVEQEKSPSPKEPEKLKVVPPATTSTVQKVSIPEETTLPKSNSTISCWRISDRHSAKSSEKVNTWMRKEIFYKNIEPRPSTSHENRQFLKESIPSMAKMSREEHQKQLHEHIRSYIEYLQTKNDTTEPDNSLSESISEANVVKVDADSLLKVFNQPLRQIASDLNLTVTRSVTDAVINADGSCSQDPIAQIMKLRNKQYGKVCEKLREFFGIVRLLDDVSGLNKKQSKTSSLSKIERNLK